MLSFTDFVKIYAAYEMYTQTVQPQPMTQVQQPMTQVQQPQPMTQVQQPQPMTQVQQPQPTTQVQQPQPMTQVQQSADFEHRLAALENRAPMPTMETPKPATVDDIIKGLIS